ncbi:hypothetical protein JCM18899A_32640 [Nocardioides sp. AN3]
MNIEEQIAWIGSIADQMRARDKDVARRVQETQPLTADLETATVQLNRNLPPEDRDSAAKIRQGRLKLLQRAVEAGRVSEQEASEIRAEIRSGSFRDNPGGLRVLRNGDRVADRSSSILTRFRALPPDARREVAEAAMRANPRLAEAVRAEQARLAELARQERVKQQRANKPLDLPVPTPVRTEPTQLSALLAAEERDRLEKYYRQFSLVERHEAAHAVVAHALGVPVERIDVGHVGDNGATRCAFEGGDSVESYLAVLFAGCRGERDHNAWVPELEALWVDQTDTLRANQVIVELGLSVGDEIALRTRVEERVDHLLSRNFQKITAVASALLRHRVLDGAQLAELLGESGWRR